MGRLVRLGPSLQDVLTRHDYPEPVSVLLGEALALTSMLGTTLDDGAKLILQTQTDGPVRLLVAHYEQPGTVRGYARFDGTRVALVPAGDGAALLGKGHLALTIDIGGRRDPYQGIVALDGESLTDAALIYFQQSAQLPTFIRLAVARQYTAPAGRGGTWRWRAGGLMLQHLSAERGDDFKLHGTPMAADADGDDPWERTRLLAATVEDHELLDPTLPPERLLYRLFHEEGVRVWPSHALSMRCRCSSERVERLLRLFSAQEIAEMSESDGSIKITCEFCSTERAFDAAAIAQIRS
jgi:molecular chaperone Hsp33